MANLVAQTYSWRSKRPPRVVPSIVFSEAPEVMDANGFFGIDTAAAAPDGYSVTDAEGFEGIDTAAISGNATRVIGGWETFLV